jgi:acetolactate synthase-1/2/3 large subunit
MRNDRLGMVSELQAQQYGGRLTATALEGSPDFVALAASYGIAGSRLAKTENIPGAIDSMLLKSGPYLLECIVDPDESTL